jgi:hypothetical protein
MTKSLYIIAAMLIPSIGVAAPLADYSFKSPAFNGSGYSSHVLTIENQEATRRKAHEDKIQAALDKAKSDAANTNMSKFLSNLESRIYAQVSQNLAAAMFKDGGSDRGTFVMSKDANGNPLTWMDWSKTLEGIQVTVNQPGQLPTTILVLSLYFLIICFSCVILSFLKKSS